MTLSKEDGQAASYRLRKRCFMATMSLMVVVTFMPFRDVIISDEIVIPYNIIIGSGMKKMFKDIYMDAKKNGRIHRSL